MELEQALAELAALKKENARIKKGAPVKFKVAPKGGVSVYGLGSRFPTTLYKAQWRKLFTEIDNLRAFIDANEDSLPDKGE